MGSQNLKSKINEVLRCNYFFKITLVMRKFTYLSRIIFAKTLAFILPYKSKFSDTNYFVLKSKKNEEKKDIRGAANGAQFIFYQIFNVNRLEQ